MPGSRPAARRDATRRGFPTRDAKTCQIASIRDTTKFTVGDKLAMYGQLATERRSLTILFRFGVLITASSWPAAACDYEDQLPETRLRAKARASDDKTGAATTQNEDEPFGPPLLVLSANFVFR
ncbi:hypothetical protein CPLU01_15760 [Colletotrichum plurivorum]|uniref:Uncharacterized protein n=1 Tax=Colletotrichum plurivorum TaxID=2175906 RepID=A0A8H6J7E3_9PEZI|nr:hypothetical protein CPLU01_15760 [Colletotrichum plurivorum]